MNPKLKEHNKTIDGQGYSFHYYQTGNKNGELLIFLHAAFADHRMFNPQLEAFAEDYNIITVDLIGHGLSQVKNSDDKIDHSVKYISMILEAEGKTKAHFVGVSLGSLIAQYFYYKYPTKVRSLTAVGSYNIHEKDPTISSGQNKFKLGAVVRALFSIKAFRRYSAQLTAYTNFGKELFYKASSHFNRRSFLVMSGLEKIIENRPNVKIDIPLLIITGEHDIELAKRASTKWHAQIEESEFKLVEGAGHCVNIDCPDLFNQILLNFLTRTNY